MLKTIDLFAGAGGLSYGFESTGEFLIVAAAENNKNARKTYIENHKGRNDIRMITDVTIKITLPSDQYEDYRSCGYNRSKYKMLNAILIVPALVEAIGIIAADEKDSEHQSGHQNRAWYKTIVVNLKRFAENDERKYLQLLEKPFASAELLLGNNSAEALDFLCQVE